MLAPRTNSRSGLSDVSNKTASATPIANKVGRSRSANSDSGSPSPVPKTLSSSPAQRLRVLAEGSPRTVESKTSNSRSNAIPDKVSPTPKGSGLKAKLDSIEQELKKTKEQLVNVEEEKDQLIKELNESRRMAYEANQKLQEVITTKQQQTEKKSEKFGASEPGQGGAEADWKTENHHSELESLRRQHALDVSALLSVIEDLQKGKHDLLDTIDAKNVALSHADDVKKVAEINTEKVEFLSGEVSRLKALLESKLDNRNKEAAEMIEKLNSEIESLRCELRRAELAEEKLIETTILSERLQAELIDLKLSESNSSKLVDVWRMKATSLEARLEETQQAKRCTSISLACNMKKLEESSTLLQDAETEIITLKEKMEPLEIEKAKYKFSLKESEQRIDLLQQEALNLGQTIAMLKSELQKLEEEKLWAINNEKIATSNVQCLSEEKNKLIDELNHTKEERERIEKSMTSDIQILLEEKSRLLDELKGSREEGESFKKAMEGFASALHQMSTESRENQEKIAIKQTEIEEARLQIEELNSVLKNTEEKYQIMLDEARYEIVCLKKSVERFEVEADNSNTDWETQKFDLVNEVKRSEDELASLKIQMAKAVESLKEAEQEAQAAKAYEVEMRGKLSQAESEATSAHEMEEEAKFETMRLRNRLLDKENELQNVTQENDDLRMRAASAEQKIIEVSALLAEATSKKSIINSESTDSQRENELLAENSKLLDNNISDVQEERLKPEVPSEKLDSNLEDCQQEREEKEKESHNDQDKYPLELTENDLTSKRHRKMQSMDDDFCLKMDDGIFEQIKDLSGSKDDDATSPMNQYQQQKKKKALLHKLGNLLLKRACSKY